jgi:hypothetical protein
VACSEVPEGDRDDATQSKVTDEAGDSIDCSSSNAVIATKNGNQAVIREL